MLRKQTQKPDIPHLLKAELTEKFFQLRQGGNARTAAHPVTTAGTPAGKSSREPTEDRQSGSSALFHENKFISEEK